jgi:hypothetical protein
LDFSKDSPAKMPIIKIENPKEKTDVQYLDFGKYARIWGWI